MGSKNSKKEVNKDMQKLGKEANNQNPYSLESGNILIYLNDLIMINPYTNPEKDYTIINFITKGKFSDINLVENKISGNKGIMKTIYKSEKFSEKEEEFLKKDLKTLTSLAYNSS